MKNGPEKEFPYTELCGALHLHTTFSDGGVTFPELIETANEVGLRYIVVTDHMSLAGKEKGYEGFHGNLFVCVGYEHNDKNNKNHYLALGTQSVIAQQNSVQDYINEIKIDGGIGFCAHPVEKRNYLESYPPYPWTQWNATGYDGFELWNQMSDWLENLKSKFHFFKLLYPRRFLVEIRKEMLAIWDESNRTRFVSGIGGVDAHTMKIKIGIFPRTVFPIKVELKGIRTHIYLKEPLPKNDPGLAKKRILDSLKNGHGFISNFRRRDAAGTCICMETANGSILCPGNHDVSIDLPVKLQVSLPTSADVRLVKNGKVIQTINGKKLSFDIKEKGLYRVEAWLQNHAWIYSNPFCVGEYPLW